MYPSLNTGHIVPFSSHHSRWYGMVWQYWSAIRILMVVENEMILNHFVNKNHCNIPTVAPSHQMQGAKSGWYKMWILLLEHIRTYKLLHIHTTQTHIPRRQNTTTEYYSKIHVEKLKPYCFGWYMSSWFKLLTCML